MIAEKDRLSGHSGPAQVCLFCQGPCAHQGETSPAAPAVEPCSPALGPELLWVTEMVPAKKPGTMKKARRRVPHVWLVGHEGKRLVKRAVRLDTLEANPAIKPRRASKKAWFLARQTVVPGTEGQHRYLVAAVLEQLRAQRATEAA